MRGGDGFWFALSMGVALLLAVGFAATLTVEPPEPPPAVVEAVPDCAILEDPDATWVALLSAPEGERWGIVACLSQRLEKLRAERDE